MSYGDNIINVAGGANSVAEAALGKLNANSNPVDVLKAQAKLNQAQFLLMAASNVLKQDSDTKSGIARNMSKG